MVTLALSLSWRPRSIHLFIYTLAAALCLSLCQVLGDRQGPSQGFAAVPAVDSGFGEAVVGRQLG